MGGGEVTIQDLGSLGELIAAVATVATLVYLALQIRQNTRTLRHAAERAVLEDANSWRTNLIRDHGVAELYRKGLLDPNARDEVVHLPNANRSWVAQYMYSLGIAVAGGTANIQRNVIGERGLGLPRDYYADRSAGK